MTREVNVGNLIERLNLVDLVPSKKANEAKMGVDYMKGVKTSTKKAAQALKDKDYDEVAAALEDVADDASDGAKAAKKMKREFDAKAAEEKEKEASEPTEEKKDGPAKIRNDEEIVEIPRPPSANGNNDDEGNDNDEDYLPYVGDVVEILDNRDNVIVTGVKVKSVNYYISDRPKRPPHYGIYHYIWIGPGFVEDEEGGEVETFTTEYNQFVLLDSSGREEEEEEEEKTDEKKDGPAKKVDIKQPAIKDEPKPDKDTIKLGKDQTMEPVNLKKPDEIETMILLGALKEQEGGSYAHRTPGWYRVHFFDGTNKDIQALSKVDAMKKVGLVTDKQVSSVELRHQTAKAYGMNVPVEKKEETASTASETRMGDLYSRVAGKTPKMVREQGEEEEFGDEIPEDLVPVTKLKTEEKGLAWIKAGGWKDATDFESLSGCPLSDIVGRWAQADEPWPEVKGKLVPIGDEDVFGVVHGRVFPDTATIYKDEVGNFFTSEAVFESRVRKDGKKPIKEQLATKELAQKISGILSEKGYEVNFDLLSNYLDEMSDTKLTFIEKAINTDIGKVLRIFRSVGIVTEKTQAVKEVKKKVQKPKQSLYLCTECAKTFRSIKAKCPHCHNKLVEKIETEGIDPNSTDSDVVMKKNRMYRDEKEKNPEMSDELAWEAVRDRLLKEKVMGPEDTISVGDTIEIRNLQNTETVVPASKAVEVGMMIGDEDTEFHKVKTERGGDKWYEAEGYALVRMNEQEMGEDDEVNITALSQQVGKMLSTAGREADYEKLTKFISYLGEEGLKLLRTAIDSGDVDKLIRVFQSVGAVLERKASKSKVNETEGGDLVDRCKARYGWVAAKQLKTILDNPTADGIEGAILDKNVLRIVYKFLKQREEEVAVEATKAIEDWVKEYEEPPSVLESKVNETEDIKQMYRNAGLPAPEGKGIHTKAFHKLAIEVAKGYVKSGDSPKEAMDKAYPTAMEQLGKEKAVKKTHQVKEDRMIGQTARAVIDMLTDKGYTVADDFELVRDYIASLSEGDLDFLEDAIAKGDEEAVIKVVKDIEIRSASEGVKEAEETYRTVAKGFEDRKDAETLAREKNGEVVVDDMDDTKFMVMVKESKLKEGSRSFARSIVDLYADKGQELDIEKVFLYISSLSTKEYYTLEDALAKGDEDTVAQIMSGMTISRGARSKRYESKSKLKEQEVERGTEKYERAVKMREDFLVELNKLGIEKADVSDFEYVWFGQFWAKIPGELLDKVTTKVIEDVGTKHGILVRILYRDRRKDGVRVKGELQIPEFKPARKATERKEKKVKERRSVKEQGEGEEGGMRGKMTKTMYDIGYSFAGERETEDGFLVMEFKKGDSTVEVKISLEEE